MPFYTFTVSSDSTLVTQMLSASYEWGKDAESLKYGGGQDRTKVQVYLAVLDSNTSLHVGR